jgi:hypothetical protein
MSNKNRNAINPPRPIYATPPACAEARVIAKRSSVEKQIEENTPSWRSVFNDIFGGK